MSFDEGIGIVLWVLCFIWIIVSIAEYRKGKRSFAMTAGLILLGFGIAGDTPLPTVAPGLAGIHNKASFLTAIGLLISLGSLWAQRKNKTGSS